ncbi:MAG: ATP phosphoribosyltransferase regulatory subunit, partial [Clostridia bacterium]|nr:ATP phosphoribosyltransferase regulatory subunit [Clostridia bacterium]
MKTYRKNIPDGMRDMVYGEIKTVKEIGERLLSLYQKRGYAEVVTPTIEYFDVFNIENRVIAEESMFKMTDKTGKLVVLRPDNTTPMARIAATRLKNAPKPIKLCYNQNVYRIMHGYSGKRSEFTQTGIEILGGDTFKADIECLTGALTSLKEASTYFGKDIDYKLEIGHAGFAKALLDSLSLDETEKELALSYVEAKNSSNVEFLSANHGNLDEAIKLIRQIPRLFGSKEVLDKARALCGGIEEANTALDYLSQIYTVLENAGFAQNITIDLSIVHEMEYYTGLVFRGYIDGAGEAVLGGGRYDTLLENFGEKTGATGFGINVSVIADSLGRKMERTADEKVQVIIHYEPSTVAKALDYAEKCDKI